MARVEKLELEVIRDIEHIEAILDAEGKNLFYEILNIIYQDGKANGIDQALASAKGKMFKEGRIGEYIHSKYS